MLSSLESSSHFSITSSQHYYCWGSQHITVIVTHTAWWLNASEASIMTLGVTYTAGRVYWSLTLLMTCLQRNGMLTKKWNPILLIFQLHGLYIHSYGLYIHSYVAICVDIGHNRMLTTLSLIVCTGSTIRPYYTL